ncbi:MAG: xanthine dehydrogenase family protein molybdopterin-binding subunit [Rhodospirillaceae bacterium]|nr:xanthine dehydrogenase family protein molybdopterin-binding subunit [Rhodospirillaceae bacterium]MBT6861306.1 xanthine dehydrogenase family protein molybdopterin-binding subunit [Rhodospirillaceae bacterium]
MNMVRIGDPVRRDEDYRLIKGHGRYADDVNENRQARAFVLRSPHAHAEIGHIDKAAALAAPGVLAVLTGDDLETRGLGAQFPNIRGKKSDGSPGYVCSMPILAQGRVRFAGQPVAFVVAESVDQAKDAVELIAVDYRVLPAVITADDALADGAPAVWDDNPGNEAYFHEVGNRQAVDAAFNDAAHRVSHRVCVNRVTGNAMEPRGCIANYDEYEDRYTLRATIQSAHGTRATLAQQIFKIPQTKIRVICDNMGGGFGIKGGCYPEYSLSMWASEVIGRPVKWIAERQESILTDEHGRGGFVDAELALDADHNFIALRTHTKVPIGAYFTTDRNIGAAVSGLGGLAGGYKTPNIHAMVTGALTNIMTNAQYRGGAKPEPCHVIEVMVDQAADQLGVDAAELRLKNTVLSSAMPYRTGLGHVYDCGDFVRNFEQCLETGGYQGFEARREDAAKRGKYLGIGLSNTVSGVAMVNFEHVEVRFDTEGGITLLCGAMDHGQGHETTFKQVLADKLGVDIDGIRYKMGDTDVVATGVGTFNARCAVFVGSAVTIAAEKIIEKGKRIAAHMMETAPGDIEYQGGTFSVAGTDKSLDITEVAKTAFQRPKLPADIEPGFYEHGEFGVGEGPVYPNGAHLVEVEIDADTGRIEITRYVAVDDAGVVLNPLLFDGQVHGGIAHGAGQILMEDIHYDDAGQLLTGSFMDYAMPRADDFCTFELAANEVPTARNPLGVKGVGEAGTVGSMPSLMNAINDALSHIGAPNVEMPATAEKVWRSIQAAE